VVSRRVSSLESQRERSGSLGPVIGIALVVAFAVFLAVEVVKVNLSRWLKRS
jgi:hypothetical protein